MKPEGMEKKAYRNWLWFIILPLGFFLGIELAYQWPYTKWVEAERQQYYLQGSLTLVGVLLFAALAGMGVNYWHYKRNQEDVRSRNLHLVISVLIIGVDYCLGKLMLFGSSVSYTNFVEMTGLTYVNFPFVERSVAMLMLVFYLFQCLYAVITLVKQRYKLKETGRLS